MTEGVTGHLRDPDDVDGMAAAALALLADDAARRAMGRAAAADVRARFRMEEVVPMYEELYSNA